MRLELVVAPDPQHRGRTDAHPICHRDTAPVGLALGRAATLTIRLMVFWS